MKALLYVLISLSLVGCADHYRYECQDPENKDKAECNRPVCETDGMCYDTLNGLPPKQEETPPPTVEEPAAAPPAADCNCETKGE